MPRLSRTVCAQVPHYIVQQGNRGEDVFLNNEDRLAYLGWLADYAAMFKLEVLAYCLTTNQIHLVAVPATEMGLQQVLKPLHMRYAQRFNRMQDWKGHVWQGRYFSSPLDNDYSWAAIRYVERNPVRAGKVRRAENYRWSSAAGHCDLRMDDLLTRKPFWRREFECIRNWSGWLAEGDEPEETEVLRRNVEKGLPCGSDKFIRKLEKQTGRALRFRPRGRPRNESDD
jgi:putative transposase